MRWLAIVRFGANFDTLLAQVTTQPDKPIALAVSGGGDSIALLEMTHDWAVRAGRELTVFTVDHGLRAASQDEAAQVAAHCDRLGHRHATLNWNAPKPSQSAARAARYRLLCHAARQHGATCILLGHTRDDVVETALIRRRRGVRDATVAGPVPVSPAPVWPEGRGISLIRPLLYESREDLRAFLADRDTTWAEDPSNDAAAFERVRVRQFLKRHHWLSRGAGEQVSRLQDDRIAMDMDIAARLSRVTVAADGLIEMPEAVSSVRLMTILARCASGSDKDARASAVREMLENVTEPGQRQTLGGAWFQKTSTGFLIGRDPGAAPDPVDADLYDGRFERSDSASLPPAEQASFLVRAALPSGTAWRETISERIAHLMACYQIPRLNPVQT